MKTTLLIVASICTVSLGFAWGFLSDHYQAFPYATVRAVASAVGLTHKREIFAPTRSRRVDVLRTLPYITSSQDSHPELRGVVESDPERFFPGYNFETLYFRPGARLLDMEANVVHEWRWEDESGTSQHAKLLPDGSVLVIMENHELIRIDRNSKLLWRLPVRAHHALDVTSDGRIFVVVRRSRLIAALHPSIPIQEDFILTVSSDGRQLESFSVVEGLLDSSFRFLLPSVSQIRGEDVESIDLLHVNQVQVFDGSLAHLSPLFAKGNLLLSSRHLNAVWIVDGRTHEILWLWGPTNIALAHDPTLLPNGNILLFDNGTSESRVIEVTVPEGQIVWESRPTDDFFSVFGGRCQRLGNGNTLITETAKGYAYEVTPANDVVWSFAVREIDRNMRGALWQLVRFTAEQLPFLRETEAVSVE